MNFRNRVPQADGITPRLTLALAWNWARSSAFGRCGQWARVRRELNICKVRRWNREIQVLPVFECGHCDPDDFPTGIQHCAATAARRNWCSDLQNCLRINVSNAADDAF